MAVQVYDPLSAAASYFKRPIDNHGKLRFIYSKFSAAVVGDIGSTFNIGKLPSGAVRLWFPSCYVIGSTWGAARTLSIGYAAYRFKQDVAAANDGVEAGSANALASALDLSGATRIPWETTKLKWDFYSLSGVDIIATLAGGTIPANGTLEVSLAYIYE